MYRDFPIRAICFLLVAMVNCAFAQSSMRLTVTQGQISDFCGTAQVKVTFCNMYRDGSGKYRYDLHYVDFSEQSAAIRKFGNVSDGILPSISPDGSLIAYATGVSGDGPTSSVSTAWTIEVSEQAIPVQCASPAYIPRFLLDANDPTVMFATSLSRPDANTPVWANGGAMVTKNLNTGTLDTLYRGGGYLGGVSHNRQYLCTAEQSMYAFMIDLEGDKGHPDTLHRLYVKKSGSNEETTVGIQCCNPSVSPSRVFPDAMMYIDFSNDAFYLPGVEVYHESLGDWGFHERIFISRFDNSIARIYDAPAEIDIDNSGRGTGEITGRRWNYPEWSNHPYFAVATAEIQRYRKDQPLSQRRTWRGEALYLINLKDSSYLRIAETRDTTMESAVNFKWPAAWIELPAGFEDEENTTWLAPRYNTDARMPYSRQKRQSGIRFENWRIYSENGLRTAALYDCTGRCVWRKSPVDRSCVVPKPVVAGCYLLKGEEVTGAAFSERCIRQGSGNSR